MSYVVQNFSFKDKYLIITWRTRYLLFLNNLNLIFFFLKTNSLYWLFLKRQTHLQSFFILLFKNFFISNWIVYFYKQQLFLPANYGNNLYLSFLYWNFNYILKQTSYFNLFFFGFNEIKIKKYFVFNLYYYPIKLVHIQLNKLFFDKIIFFFFFYGNLQWMDFEKPYNLIQPYFISQPFFKLNYFYSNFFFVINNN